MIKEIQYGGLSATPDDYQSPDGQLTTALNLIPEDNQLKPLFPPQELCTLPESCSVLFIHSTSAFTHYIILELDVDQQNEGNALHWIDSSQLATRTIADIISDGSHIAYDFGARQVFKLSSMGNTLLVIASDGLHYILWRDTTYAYLGQKPPLLNLSFGTSEMKTDTFTDLNGSNTADKSVAFLRLNNAAENYCTLDNDDHLVKIKSSFQKDVTDAAWALVNSTNATITAAGHFYAPFFVRYCYRLFDGSLYMHSAPVFIPLSAPTNFRVELMSVYNKTLIPSVPSDLVFQPLNIENSDPYMVNDYDARGNQIAAGTFYNFTLRYRPSNVALTCIADPVALDDLRTNWVDIVKSVDIFVSLPITREISDRNIETATPLYHNLYYANNQLFEGGFPTRRYYDPSIQQGVPAEMFTASFNVCLDFPMLSDEEYLDKISSVASFFLLHSFDLSSDSIPTDAFAEVPVKTDLLQALAAQEPMSDDYKSHNSFLPAFDQDGHCISSLFPYNSRLNMAGVYEKLFKGFPPSALVPADQSSVIYVITLIVYIKSEFADRAVLSLNSPSLSAEVSPLLFSALPLFYPDNRAYALEVQYYTSNPRRNPNATLYKSVLPMQQHPLLNGAITQPSLLSSLSYTLASDDTLASIPSSDMAVVPTSNKLYTSEVNNPFIFPATGINTIGSGFIFGLSSAVKALSQGQFGQFPLYAFTSEGVWALEVSSMGSFSARQPITRDVCTNPDAITQLDSAVLFPTHRGLMLLQGSEALCISDPLATEHPFNSLSLPSASRLHTLLDHSAGTCFPSQPFSAFLAGSRMLYDYLHQHIIVYNPSFSYAYVYSLRSKLWGMMHSNLASSLNSYPDALAMDRAHRLVSFSQSTADGSAVKSLLITRPLKLDAPDTLKTIRTLIVRGLFQRGDVQTVLYGSRDLYSWHLVASSSSEAIRNLRGTPYKYFRIATLATLAPDKSLSGATLDIQNRHTNLLL